MDAYDFMLLWLGCSCLGAALITLMCERAPVMTWDDEPVDLDEVRRVVKAPLATGGVIHRSYIIPVTCDHYTRHAWYVCGTTEQIIEHLWLKREMPATNDNEEDGA